MKIFCISHCRRGIFSTRSSACIWSFFAACDHQEWNSALKKRGRLLCLSRCPRQCILQVSGNALQQVETFQYLGVVFSYSRVTEVGTNGLIHRFVKLTRSCMNFISPCMGVGRGAGGQGPPGFQIWSKKRLFIQFWVVKSKFDHFWPALEKSWKNPLVPPPGKNPSDPMAPWWRNGCFQRPQVFQLLNLCLFRSSPVVMNLRWRLKEYCQKSRPQRWDIYEETTVWHFVTKSTCLKSVKPGMSSQARTQGRDAGDETPHQI